MESRQLGKSLRPIVFTTDKQQGRQLRPTLLVATGNREINSDLRSSRPIGIHEMAQTYSLCHR